MRLNDIVGESYKEWDPLGERSYWHHRFPDVSSVMVTLRTVRMGAPLDQFHFSVTFADQTMAAFRLGLREAKDLAQFILTKAKQAEEDKR